MAKQNLPHTRNSEAGANMYEPIIASQFMVYLLPPEGISGGSILTQHVQSISGLFVEKGGDSITEQGFQTAQRSYASTEKTTTYDVEVAFSLNLNNNAENYVYNTLRAWSRRKYNPLTGEMGLKKDYVGSLVGEKFRVDGTIFWRRTLHQAWLQSDIPDLDGDYGTHDAQSITVTFRGDFITDETI